MIWRDHVFDLVLAPRQFFSRNFVPLVADFGPKLKTWSRQVMFYTKINSGLPFLPIPITVLVKHFCMLRIFDICKPMCTIAPGVIWFWLIKIKRYTLPWHYKICIFQIFLGCINWDSMYIKIRNKRYAHQDTPKATWLVQCELINWGGKLVHTSKK